MKAVIYARYSSERQTEQSIEGQVRKCKEYAESHKMKIIGEYIDRAMSGMNDQRTEFQRMLRDTARGLFDVILIYKIDRFGRNRYELALNRKLCTDNGVKIISVAENIPEGPEGILLESLLEGMAEYYSIELRQKILRGQRESAEKGQVINASIPFGYKKVNKRLAIDPVNAPVVQEIYKSFLDGETMADIGRRLKDRGIVNGRGKPFGYNGIHGILKNERYTGVYIYKDIVRIEDGIPAIIDRESFDKVQEKMKMNKRKPQKGRPEFMLTGKIFCGKCGDVMTGDFGTSKSGKEYFYYTCANKKKRKSCDMKSIPKGYLEELVVTETVVQMLKDEVIEEIADATMRTQDKRRTFIDKLEKDLKEVEKSISNMIEAVKKGFFSPEMNDQMSDLQEQKETLIHNINLEKLAKPRFSREQIVAWLHSFKGGDISDPEYGKMLVGMLVTDITVYEDHVEISYSILDTKNTPPQNAEACSSKKSMVEQAIDSSNISFCEGVVYLSIASNSLRYTSSGLACLSNNSHTAYGYENCTRS